MQNSSTVALALIAGMMVVVILSAVTGAQKGVQWPANPAMGASVLMLLFMLVVGPTGFLLSSVSESITGHLQNLMAMSARTGTYSETTGSVDGPSTRRTPRSPCSACSTTSR